MTMLFLLSKFLLYESVGELYSIYVGGIVNRAHGHRRISLMVTVLYWSIG
jgi:hypothetical protein